MKTPPEDLVQKLLDASDQFVGTGLDVSIDDVAKMSGVPRATLYYYFSGKDDLAAFFIKDKLTRGTEIIEKASALEGSCAERLEAMIRGMVGAMSEYPILCTEMPIAIRRMGQHVEMTMRVERDLLGPLRDLLIEGRALGEFVFDDVGVATSAITGAVMQVSLMAVTESGGRFDHEQVSDGLVPLMLRGLLANS